MALSPKLILAKFRSFIKSPNCTKIGELAQSPKFQLAKISSFNTFFSYFWILKKLQFYISEFFDIKEIKVFKSANLPIDSFNNPFFDLS